LHDGLSGRLHGRLTDCNLPCLREENKECNTVPKQRFAKTSSTIGNEGIVFVLHFLISHTG